MKQNVFYVSLLMAAIILSGCGDKPEAAASAEESLVLGPKWHGKSGLLVPDDTRESLGLKIIEVTEQKVPATLSVQLRIYETGTEHILASASILPEEAKLLRSGQAVRARLSGSSVTGTVEGVNDEAHRATGTAEVLVKISRPPGSLPAGPFLPASIALDSGEAAIAIPRSALLECSEGHSVYTVNGEHLVRAPVKVGAMSGDLVEIKDGLYAGDEIVLEPVMSLWMTELAAVKGGQACCVMPAKGK